MLWVLMNFMLCLSRGFHGNRKLSPGRLNLQAIFLQNLGNLMIDLLPNTQTADIMLYNGDIPYSTRLCLKGRTSRSQAYLSQNLLEQSRLFMPSLYFVLNTHLQLCFKQQNYRFEYFILFGITAVSLKTFTFLIYCHLLNT